MLEHQSNSPSIDDITKPRAGGSSDEQSVSSTTDETDYEHRHLINLMGAAALLIVAIAVIWTVKAMEDYEALERCVSTGRHNCIELDVPAPPSVRIPTR